MGGFRPTVKATGVLPSPDLQAVTEELSTAKSDGSVELFEYLDKRIAMTTDRISH